MNDLLKASKRVLKTLSQLNLGDYPPPLQGGLNDEIEDLFEAIKKAENQKSMALEEFIQTYQKGYREGKEDALAQPEQEQEPFCYHDGRNIVGKEYANHSDVFPLYTAPPKREWVGLTDEEYDELMLSGDWGGSLIQATQNKLKEKNT